MYKPLLFMTKVIFRTYGCSNNFSESEAMQGLLEKAGFSTTESEQYEDADVIVFNMCSVKGPSINHCLRQIKAVKEKSPQKNVVVAGCVPRELIPTIKGISSDISVVSTHHIDQIAEVVEKTLHDDPARLVAFSTKPKLGFPKRRKNPVVGIVPILSGCNDHCTYCSTKLIKGPTVSYPEQMIVQEVANAVKDGCREIWLTSQDNGAYMTDNGHIGLPGLIEQICKIEGTFYVRVGMANPTYLLQCLPQMKKVMQNEKVFKFLHIPVQAGSNEVLRQMKRRYTVEEYKQIVSELKTAVPELTIATDIICGFPTETDEQFEETLALVRKTRPEIVNISRFQARPGTRAAVMQQLPRAVVNARSQKLTELFRKQSLEQHKALIGKEMFVLVDEHGKDGKSHGKNISYMQVIIKEHLPLGSIVKVKIVDAGIFHVDGELLKERVYLPKTPAR